MSSLNQDGEPMAAEEPAIDPEAGTDAAAVAAAAVAAARTISKRGEEARGGFVLRAKSEEMPHRRRSLVERTGMKTLVQGLKLKKQRSTGDLDRKGVTSIRSTGSTTSWMSSESGFTTGASMMSEGSNQSFALEDEQLDASVTETYMGEWKNDKRCGFGISERSDGLKYEGEWYNNRKYGYGVTTHRGEREEGKYKNNVLVTSNQKRHLFLIRSAKFRERIDSALNAAQRASKIALQKADIAISRTATARGKAEQADIAAVHAREDAQMAVSVAKQFGGPSSDVNADNAGNKTAVGSPATAAAGISAEPNVANNLLNVKNHNPTAPTSLPSPASPNRPRTPEVVIHAPMDKQTKPLPPAKQQPPKPSSAASNTTSPSTPAQPPQPAAPSSAQRAAPPPSSKPPTGVPNFGAGAAQAAPAPVASSNNVMQRSSVSTMMRSLGSGGSGAPAASMAAATVATPSTKCDISNTTESAMFQQIPNHKPLQPLPLQIQQSQQPQQQQQQLQQSQLSQQPQATSARMLSQIKPRGRSPAMHQQQSLYQQPQSSQQPQYESGGGGAAGGYNFQRIMDDHFEHYKRPASSREQSVDKTNLPSSLAEAAIRPPRGRSGSRQLPQALLNSATPSNNLPTPSGPPPAPGSSSRATSRTRTPLPPLGTSHTDMDLDLRRKELEAKFAQNNGDLHEPPKDDGLRFRGQPSQEIAHLGTIPKRTESLYLKQSLEPKGKDTQAISGTLQRKKSLPDVHAIDVTTKAQGSKAMTREEISVLSSARREAVRRQLEEIERYKTNPFLYILNPRVKEWISRQKLMLLILFINLSLAIMFFKLLT